MKTSRLIASAIIMVATLVAPVGMAYAGFYPADRQTYTCLAPLPDGSVPCPGADHVVFNSFINNPVVGDERPFLAGTINTGTGTNAAVQDRLKVKDGDTLVVRAYVHNNADDAKMAGGEAATVAKNVIMRVLVPSVSQKDTNIVAFIDADNASPKSINDTMSVYGDNAFTLEYVKGSAQFSHKADGVHQITDKLSDSIVTQAGAPLGNILGCFQYSGYVTLTVKVHMPTTPTPPVTPPTTPTPPTALPNTGAGDVVGIFGAVAVVSALAHRLFLSRKLSRN